MMNESIFEKEAEWINKFEENQNIENAYNVALFYFQDFQHYDKAKIWIDKALKISQENNDVNWLASKIAFEIANNDEEKINAYKQEQKCLVINSDIRNNFPMHLTPIEIWFRRYSANKEK